MNTIKYLYIPRVEVQFTAKFIADVFSRNNIAMVSRIYMEPHRRGGWNKHNKAFIEIDSWYETENAYNFLCKLKNPRKEARIVYGDDNWWSVNINRYQHKLYAFNKPVLTVFNKAADENNDESLDALSVAATIDEMPDSSAFTIDVDKTIQLRNIVLNLSKKQNKEDKEEGEIDELACETNVERAHWTTQQIMPVY